MLGIIDSWLLNQVGINCNVHNLGENNLFQDGCVLAIIFEKYGLVNESFRENVYPTNKKGECTKNLKLLKPLFDMLKIRYDENIINGIAENKAGTILNLLYELYIRLENKQHLYFITKTNFEQVCLDTAKNLNSVTVNKTIENSESKWSTNKCLEQPLMKNVDVIKWYKDKYEKVKTNLEQKETQMTIKKESMNVKSTCKSCTSKHKFTKNLESFDDLPDLNSFLKSGEDKNLLNYDAFIARYKSKQNSKAARKCFENAIQHEMLHRTWSRIEEKEDKMYNSVVSSILLKQSHYEKQILSKLIQAEKETHVQNENKIWAKHNVINEYETKLNCDFELKDKFELLEQMYANEQKRVLELHKKLYKEKKEIIKKENFNICKDIVDALIEIAVCAAEYKSDNGVEVYKSLWDNWMQLFIKSQPIRVQLKSLEKLAGEDYDYVEAISFEQEQDEVLNENYINEYLMTCGRWYYESVCLEHSDLNENNLAFIVYRLLYLKYPVPPSPPAADLPPFKVAGVLLNFHHTDSVEKLKLLLSKSRIHIFDTEMAIRKCMNHFKTETILPLEENLKNKKNESMSSKQQKGKDKKNTKKKEIKESGKGKNNKFESSKLTLDLAEEDKIVKTQIDKETQTLTDIEVEKTKRTPLGLLGEEVCNTLNEGGKLHDSLLVSVITEYLKTLKEYDGWILLNYPQTIGQAYYLEISLTGKKIPMGEFVSEENKNLEVDELDDWAEKRKSRLLNYPANIMDNQSFKSYFTTVVKIHPEETEIVNSKKNTLQNDQLSNSIKSNEIKEEVNSHPDFLRDFYTKLAIFKEFNINHSDLNTLKSLARVIIKEDGIEAKPSVDLFGEDTLSKLTKGKKIDKNGKSSLKKRISKQKKELKSNEITVDNVTGSINPNKPNDVVESLGIADKDNNLKKADSSTQSFKELPTEEEEQNNKIDFVRLPINNEFGILLATIWENIETCYITNLKDIIFENRFINLRVHPYCVYVEKEMKKVIDKQDLKQNLINIFRNDYNNISNELRTVPEMKNHLHCRVEELQRNLWDIADERKQEIEARRQDIIYENWLVSEICLLINNYVSFVQTEFDRSLETLILVNEYYMNMLEKTSPALTIMPENRMIDRIRVEMLLKPFRKSTDKSEGSKEYDVNETSKTNFIVNSLVSCSEEQHTIDIFETIILEKITEVKSNFSAMLQIFLAQHKTEANHVAGPNKEGTKNKSLTNKNGTSIKPKKEAPKQKISKQSDPSQKEVKSETSMKELLIQEWQTTINTETTRLDFRLDLIEHRAKENIIEFYCFLESLFCNLHQSILTNYNTEISNINSMCDYLKTAIEEESPLHHPLILGQERFVIGIAGTEIKNQDYILTELKEDFHECIFTISQLNHLLDIFKISGPLGVIRKQPLCYIFQDFMLIDNIDNQPSLPKMWSYLSGLQLRYVIDDIIGLEFGVDWKDFIVYNLDIPYPDVKDILHLMNQFNSFDLEDSELILLQDYEKITLWFEHELPSSPKQGLRFAKVKKLLSELFKVDSIYVNYTALLLYFCKDFDPVLGLKKALSLSLGKNVVVTISELEAILQNEKEVNDTVSSLLEEIIDGIVLTRETAQISDILDPLSERTLSTFPISRSIEDVWNSSQFGSLKHESFKSIETDPTNLTPHVLHKSKTSCVLDLNTSSNEKSWVTRIPMTAVLSVLNACFFYQDRKFALKNQYLNCLLEAADKDGMIEAYDLVNLSCIKKLFTMTNKFKISIPCDILRDSLNITSKSEVYTKKYSADYL